MPRFQKGQSGNPAGRPRGIQDKRTLKVEEKLAERGLDPIVAMADLALETEDESIKAMLLKELAQYVAPKLRATQISTTEMPAVKFVLSLDGAAVVIDAEESPALPSPMD